MKHIKTYESKIDYYNQLKKVLDDYFNYTNLDDSEKLEDFRLEIESNGTFYTKYNLEYKSLTYQEIFYAKIENRENILNIIFDRSEYNDEINKILDPLILICNDNNDKLEVMGHRDTLKKYTLKDNIKIQNIIKEFDILTDKLRMINNTKKYNL